MTCALSANGSPDVTREIGCKESIFSRAAARYCGSRCKYFSIIASLPCPIHAFDLLWINCEDIRQQPLIERKQRLCGLVRGCEPVIYAQHIEGVGKQLFREICARDLEGIVAKRKLSIYKDDGNSWLTIKNRAYLQAEGTHELLEGKQ